MDEAVEVGLCKTCSFARITGNRRGSIFYFCDYSNLDPTFEKYPRLPVLTCSGYQKTSDDKQRLIGGTKHED
jgi:hypothetical protein